MVDDDDDGSRSKARGRLSLDSFFCFLSFCVRVGALLCYLPTYLPTHALTLVVCGTSISIKGTNIFVL